MSIFNGVSRKSLVVTVAAMVLGSNFLTLTSGANALSSATGDGQYQEVWENTPQAVLWRVLGSISQITGGRLGEADVRDFYGMLKYGYASDNARLIGEAYVGFIIAAKNLYGDEKEFEKEHARDPEKARMKDARMFEFSIYLFRAAVILEEMKAFDTVVEKYLDRLQGPEYDEYGAEEKDKMAEEAIAALESVSELTYRLTFLKIVEQKYSSGAFDCEPGWGREQKDVQELFFANLLALCSCW